ncbi:MAG: hypothetical protein HKN47_22280 [Pirellulaceae bacterium]|nr:hypothetical protein [Pirellulaceae bacterium]
MAKKKKTAKKKTTRRRVAKKKPSAKKKSSATSRKSARPKKSTSRGTSVDTLLKRFEQERRAKETVLDGSQKQIQDLQAKVIKLEEQISKLKQKAAATQSEMDQLDSRRDAEVSELLVRLGVHLTGSSAATESSKTNASSSQRPALTLGTSTLELDKKTS